MPFCPIRTFPDLVGFRKTHSIIRYLILYHINNIYLKIKIIGKVPSQTGGQCTRKKVKNNGGFIWHEGFITSLTRDCALKESLIGM